MSRAEMIAYLDEVLAGITTRGIAAPSVVKGRLRQDFKKVTAIKEAVAKYVPASVAPVSQPKLFNERG